MNNVKCQSLFFIHLPELQKFCAVRVILSSQLEVTQLRTAQRKMCRKLLLLDQDVLSSPVPGTLNQISVIMTIPFYNSGKLQAYVEKHGAVMGIPERVVPAVFQTCLSYTLIAKLAPGWNQAGHLLIQGRDFLSHPGKQNAVVMDINVSETHLCISVEVCTVRLPPAKLEDFYISPNTLKRFESDKNEIIQRHSILSNWCYVLPSMKMGQIISISHLIPPDSTFQSYRDIQLYWEHLYGYVLSEDLKLYCSVYFKPIGEQLYTYPLSCIRSQPVQYFPRVDLEGVVSAFLTDLKAIIPRTFGFPLKMTSKALYATQELTQSSLQKVSSIPPNLTRKRNWEVILTPGVPQKDFSPAECDTGNSHKMELKVNKPKTVTFFNLGSLAKDKDTKDGAVEKQAQSQKRKTSEESALMVHSNKSLKISNNSSVGSFKKDSPRIIPIFKGKLLQQQDMNITKIPHGKNKQNISRNSAKVKKVDTTAKLDIFKPSLYQVKKTSHGTPLENIRTGSLPQTQLAKTNVKCTKRALKEKNEHDGALENCSLANGAILDGNSSRIKSRRLNSSLLAMDDTSMHHESIIQYLEKPAIFSSRGQKSGFLSPVKGPSKHHSIKAASHQMQLYCLQEEGGSCVKPKKQRTNKPPI